MHAKLVVVDERYLFTDSMNLDGRSRYYKTEGGVVIDRIGITRRLLDLLDFESSAYRLRLSPDGQLQWVDSSEHAQIVHGHEPETTFWQRLRAQLGALLEREDWL